MGLTDGTNQPELGPIVDQNQDFFVQIFLNLENEPIPTPNFAQIRVIDIPEG